MRWTKTLCVIALSTACSSGRSHIDVSPAEVPFAEPLSTGAEAPIATPAVVPMGPLTRSLLRRTVSEGIGAFLAGVDLSPALDHGRFVGFRIDRADSLRRWNASGVDLRTGDVISRINGSPIERPEQAQAVFLGLFDASEIVVETFRAGAPRTVRIAVVPDAEPVTASDAGVTAAR